MKIVTIISILSLVACGGAVDPSDASALDEPETFADAATDATDAPSDAIVALHCQGYDGDAIAVASCIPGVACCDDAGACGVCLSP